MGQSSTEPLPKVAIERGRMKDERMSEVTRLRAEARSLLYCSSFFELRRSTTHFPQYQISSIRLPVIAISSRIPQQWQGI